MKCTDEFFYHDPVDHSVSYNPSLRIFFQSDARAVFRLPGTVIGTDHGKDT